MANEENSSGTMSERFPVGTEDVVILPIVAIALIMMSSPCALNVPHRRP